MTVHRWRTVVSVTFKYDEPEVKNAARVRYDAGSGDHAILQYRTVDRETFTIRNDEQHVTVLWPIS